MIIGSVLIVHMAIAFFGVRSLWKQKLRKEAFLYALLIAVSAYSAIARRASLPLLSITEGITIIFEPVEKWIEKVLGGPFS